nr:AlpA family phage regulatory protein [Paraburkholderia phenazinium]
MPVSNSSSQPRSPKVLRMRALTERIGLSRSEIYRRIKAGTFPQTLSLGQRSVGWLESDIDAWIDALSQRGDA